MRSELGEIRLRSIFELLFIFVVGYAAVQVGPAVKLRIDFLNEMEVAANSPIQKSEHDIRYDLLKAGERIGLTIFADDLFVERNTTEKKTLIRARYEIHVNFWPRFTYVWRVEDQVEGYLL